MSNDTPEKKETSYILRLRTRFTRIRTISAEEYDRMHKQVERMQRLQDEQSEFLRQFEMQVALEAKRRRSQPPAYAEKVLLLVLPAKDADAILGDMQERFTKVAAKHGPLFAQWYYVSQAFRSACAVLLAMIMRIGPVASLVERIWRIFG